MARRYIRDTFGMFAAGAIALAACGGEAGPPGPEGPPGSSVPGGEPSVSAVSPTSAFLARTADVTLSGNGTAWSDATTVDFGKGIKVNRVVAASPTGLVVNITVAEDAELGPRDVTVTDREASQSFAGAFTVESPLKVTVEGTLAQGSITFVRARSLDFDTPFDTTTTGDGLFTPLEFTHIALREVKGTTAIVNDVSDYAVDYVMLLDIDAATGAQDIAVDSGVKGDMVAFPHPDAVTIAARTPTSLTAGTPAKGKVEGAYTSSLYAFKPTSAFSWVRFATSAGTVDGKPAVLLLPPSGKTSEALGYAPAVGYASLAAKPSYAVLFDSTGASGYSYEVAVVEEKALGGGAEKEPNNDKASATPLDQSSFVIKGASLADADPNPLNPQPLIDWYALTVTADDVAAGRKIHVTTGGDPSTDPVIDVVLQNGVSPFGEPSDDADYHEDYTSEAVPVAGTYFVRIYPSEYFDPAHAVYDAFIRLE